MFAFGFLAGLLVSILILVAVMFFRKPIEQKLNVIEKNVGNLGPRPKGYVIDPSTEIEETREDIIKKNSEEGRDTPIEDLR